MKKSFAASFAFWEALNISFLLFNIREALNFFPKLTTNIQAENEIFIRAQYSFAIPVFSICMLSVFGIYMNKCLKQTVISSTIFSLSYFPLYTIINNIQSTYKPFHITLSYEKHFYPSTDVFISLAFTIIFLILIISSFISVKEFYEIYDNKATTSTDKKPEKSNKAFKVFYIIWIILNFIYILSSLNTYYLNIYFNCFAWFDVILNNIGFIMPFILSIIFVPLIILSKKSVSQKGRALLCIASGIIMTPHILINSLMSFTESFKKVFPILKNSDNLFYVLLLITTLPATIIYCIIAVLIIKEQRKKSANN